MQGPCNGLPQPMNTRILNRAGKLPEDGWYQIETPGEHINHEAKVVQVIDDKAITSIVNRFTEEAKAPNFAGQLVDRDHFSSDPDKPSDAMGWTVELRNRNGIPEGRIDWTTAGQPLVEGKVYKFFSTDYRASDCEVLGKRIVDGKSYRVVRPLRLDRLALTNDPNNAGGKPISNRQTAATADRGENQNTSTMKSVLKLLGLAEDASEESAVAAVQKIQNRASQVDALITERDSLLTAQVEADLKKYEPVIKNRDAWKKQLISNRASAIELLEGLSATAGTETDEEKKRITNRAGAKTPGAERTDAEKQQAESARAQRISNRASELQATAKSNGRRLSHTDAFNAATAEIDDAAAK